MKLKFELLRCYLQFSCLNLISHLPRLQLVCDGVCKLISDGDLITSLRVPIPIYRFLACLFTSLRSHHLCKLPSMIQWFSQLLTAPRSDPLLSSNCTMVKLLLNILYKIAQEKIQSVWFASVLQANLCRNSCCNSEFVTVLAIWQRAVDCTV